jgi:PAS domain-containing protein
MGLTDLPLIAEIAIAITTLAGMWYAGIRWVLPKLAATKRALTGLMDVGTRSKELLQGIETSLNNSELLQTIKHEVLPNGNSSMRDAVSRTESSVNLMIGQIRARADADDIVAQLDCDHTGRVEWLSRPLMIWTQRTHAELEGNGWISSVHPDDREAVGDEWARCVRYNRQFDSAFRLIDRDGDIVLVRMSGVSVTTRRTASESIVRWVATMRRIDGANDSLLVPDRGHLQSRAP